MKEKSLLKDLKNREKSKDSSEPKKDINEENNSPKSPNLFFSFKSSFNELKQRKIIGLNIINSKISITEYYQKNPYLSQNDIYIINEINKKYKNSQLSLFDSLDKIVKTPQPLFLNNSETILNINLYNKDPIQLSQNILNNNEKIFEPNLINDLNHTNFANMNKNLTLFEKYSRKNSFDNSENNIFLNRKRKKTNDKLKKYKRSMVLIKNKNDNEKEISNLNEEEYIKKKKIIFFLSKGERSKNKIHHLKDYTLTKIKKHPGRKKKNSGEIGTHNKFSKDNMMRKLKNKVMESARKLINRLIKTESNNEFKKFREIRKIEGIYSQELNIKFNFWFYFQQLKDIFQFKMSSKYSKGDLNSNYRLINKIYSKEEKNKFPKTIQLLEMKFHEYYHNIFLGEDKNWYLNFNIKEKENKYQLDYFLNNGVSKIDKDYIRYKNTICNLASKYELFFLKKNPRLTAKKNKKENESQSKKIIKSITSQQFNIYRYNFVSTGVKYVPEMANIYSKYLKENKIYLFPLTDAQTQTQYNTNINISKEINSLDNTNKIQENIKNNINVINNALNNNFVNNINNENINSNINYNANKSINTRKNNNKKSNLFAIKKKVFFEIVKKTTDKNNKQIFKYSQVDLKNSYESKIFDNISKINNSSSEESKQKIEKEVQTENNLIPEESSQNIEIVI